MIHAFSMGGKTVEMQMKESSFENAAFSIGGRSFEILMKS